MATTYTKWQFPPGPGFGGIIRVAPGDTISTFTLKFRFLDKSYLDLNEVEAADISVYLSQGSAIVITPVLLQPAIPDDQHTKYYDNSGTPQAFSITSFADGVYHYTFTNGSDVEAQYLVRIPAIEEKIETLAKQLMDSQCNCQLNRSVMDNFVKAKALQQLIYSKVLDMSPDYNEANFDEVNADVKVLSDFLAGTNSVCGC